MDLGKVRETVVAICKKPRAVATVEAVAEQMRENDLDAVRRALDELADANVLRRWRWSHEWHGEPEKWAAGARWYTPL